LAPEDPTRLTFSSLDQVHQALRACRRCPDAGYQVFPRAIFSGSQGARVMIIGQAPGITEKDAGRPFNATSGRRLFQWLEAAGFEETSFRREQYMTSVTKCYPGRSGGASGDRPPSAAEQRLCRPFLEAEIHWVNPSLIIPVGRLAINLFFPAKQPLGEIIGHTIRVDGRWIVPLPHPSGASRWHQSPANRQRIQQAIGILRDLRVQLGL
jgi:uracil-DNA glycosylase